MARGPTRDPAEQVAVQLTERDALGSHARDDLGMSGTVTAHPVQAALVPGMTLAVGAAVPLLAAMRAPPLRIVPFVAVATRLSPAILGGPGATAGGAAIQRGAVRVTFRGALAMAATALVGSIFGVTVGRLTGT